MVRLYLPRSPDLVHELVNAPPSSNASAITINDIRSLMVGVHLAAISEAMSFCELLSIDVDLMFDIISNAAGVSDVFLNSFADMRRGAWSLKAVQGIDQIKNLLVSAAASHELQRPNILRSLGQLTRFAKFDIRCSCPRLLCVCTVRTFSFFFCTAVLLTSHV